MPRLGFGYLLLVCGLFFFLLTTNYLPPTIHARVTPEDIVNEQKSAYEQTLGNYSPENRQKIEEFSKKIADFNAEKTYALELIAQRQGEILDEYVRRNNIEENGGADGIHRSNDPVSVARIEITRAHEAIAYQAAKVYIPSLSGQSNIKSDSLNLINRLQYDMNIAKNKLVYSHSLLENLLEKR